MQEGDFQAVGKRSSRGGLTGTLWCMFVEEKSELHSYSVLMEEIFCRMAVLLHKEWEI